MSGGKTQGGKPEQAVPDTTSGSGASGEGADSAMEAMLKKRQMRVNPPDPTARPAVQQQGDKKAGKSSGHLG
ncbi:MAG: hypothetical protein JWQ13_3310 [Ramlibacter sp.]|jgi:hypothetical protein|nr:hypothetical protein [Ramlibacter sp.]